MDGFDRIPDPLILFIFNSISDVKTLIRCRAVSKRFNSLVPQTESLLLKVDCVITPESDESITPFLNFFKTIVKSVHNLVSLSAKTHPELQNRPALSQNCPAHILRGFERIRELVIELPAGDLKLDRNAVVKWKAEFGETLKNCVILAFRDIRASTSTQIPAEFADFDFADGLKLRVVWTISALIAASARHYLLRELVEEHEEIEKLVLRDKEGEGTLVMNKEGLAELRAAGVAQVSEHKEWAAHYRGWDQESSGSRTMVPSVRMRMRHVAKTELKSGEWLDGATLVVVRPTTIEDVAGDVNLALLAFQGDGVCGEAVQALVKTRSYHLEMNSF
ncbi:hypothetical protein ACB098_10G145200 [Castanea mollissima]